MEPNLVFDSIESQHPYSESTPKCLELSSLIAFTGVGFRVPLFVPRVWCLEIKINAMSEVVVTEACTICHILVPMSCIVGSAPTLYIRVVPKDAKWYVPLRFKLKLSRTG